MNFVRLSLISIACLLASAAFAEGAVRTFECTIEKVCDASGQCETAEGEITFRLQPQQLDNNGAGSYRLAYEDTTVDMQAISDAGPFTWMTDAVRHTLLVTAETRLLWHSLSLAAPLQSRSQFLECTLAQ
jgi:hypothetical protein